MRSWTTGICKVNDIEIHYYRTGGNKPPIVFLHGLMTSGACLAQLALMLQETYDVILPDSRGHGFSSAPEQGYHYEVLANDVISLLDALNLSPPVLMGHSMGGMTAAVVASQNPNRIRGLILADPPFLTPKRQQEVYESDVVDQHRQVLEQSKEVYLAQLKVRHGRRSPEIVEQFAEARFQTSINAFEILKPPNPDFRELIQALKIPSLLVIGGVGSIISPELATELAVLNQHLSVEQIKEAGHAIPYDQPEQFLWVFKQFYKLL